MSRTFLMLQGPASPFFPALAEALRMRGFLVKRVNFCGGDMALCNDADTWNYTGLDIQFKDWLDEKIKIFQFTDVFLFGDCRPIHLDVHALSELHGMQVHVFEEGYVRPSWITMEDHGVNGRSKMPKDPAWYLDPKNEAPPSSPPIPTGYNLYERAFHDIRYRVHNWLSRASFPYYKSHRPYDGLTEYKGLLKVLLKKRQNQKHYQSIFMKVMHSKHYFHLFPLQLSSDYQIREHSPFSDLNEAIDVVITSFARNSNPGTILLIKQHPLDTEVVDHEGFAKKVADNCGVGSRVFYIKEGHLPTILECSKSVVTINSTVGLSALHHRRPLICLGEAIYDMEGLTFQHGLDRFWLDAHRPNDDLYNRLLNHIIENSQINGDFYSKSGISMSIEGILRRLFGAGTS